MSVAESIRELVTGESAGSIFTTLRRQHREVSDLVDIIVEADDDLELRVNTFETFRLELLSHAKGEEEVVYPALQAAQPTHELVLEAIQEHRVVANLVNEIHVASVHTELWMAKFSVLKENLEHHIKEEQNELFTKGRTLLTTLEQEELNTQYRSAQARHKKAISSAR